MFREQIKSGGPVTVTHKDITRYFMMIPEACQLILKAMQLNSDGRILVLDMGAPIKIDDLARKMIQLSGKNPGVDIEIKYTGLRSGEKLYFSRGKKLNPLISAQSTRPTGLQSTATSSRSRCSAWSKTRRSRRVE